MTKHMPKAELHSHIEGATPPALALAQAQRYGIDTSGFIRNGEYAWQDFTSFVQSYDATANLFRTEEDYALLAETYLTEVETGAVRWPQPAIRALVAETRAGLLPSADPAATQLRLLARQLWTSARLDYQAARVRLELAATYLAAGDQAGAEAEIAAAEFSARRIASPRLLAEAATLRQRLTPRAA